MTSQETLQLLKDALQKSNADPALAKAFTQSASQLTGLTAFSLEAPAKTLYPVLTPFRNALPRTVGGTGIQANWRAITAINNGRIPAGLAEGARGGVINTTVREYLAAFRGLGLDDNVTFEADMAAQGFDDVKARATEGLLRSLMIEEERVIVGGNGSLALGTTPTPTLTTATSGGAITASTAVQVVCVALTPFGFGRASVANGVEGQITFSRGDGSSSTVNGGTAQQSSVASVTVGGSGNAHTVSASVSAVRGAAGYAWYVGTGGTQRIAAITTINSVLITAVPGSGQTLAASNTGADYSTSSLEFDGLLTMAANAINGSYFRAMPTGTAGTGTGLTADAAGGIQEFDEALQWFWDNHRLSPTNIWVSSQEQNWIRRKVLTGNTSAVQRFAFSAAQQSLLGGTSVQGYTNPFTMGSAKTIPIAMHPNLPAGTVLFTTNELPYTLSGVTDVMRMLLRRDYYQIEWPMRTRRYEYGVYMDGVLQHYFPPSMGILTNIAAA
ncbi:hypothetical protein [Falsiroseomonas sp. CW058]|uniref:hypothetical protein n=1 Tax=Falsiroseomonas sp. CW058 TaxID=3388664 RepID=UPI003D313604